MENRRQTTRIGTMTSAMVVIGKDRFRLNDISNQGMGIVVEGPDAFVWARESKPFTSQQKIKTCPSAAS